MKTKNLELSEYKLWIKDVANEYKQLQIKAVYTVNLTMLEFFYKLGKDIQLRIDENIYGTDFFNNVSNDLKHNIPNAHSFSVTNLRYMVKFYNLLNNQNIPQVVEKLNKSLKKVSNKSNIQNYSQVVEKFIDNKFLFSVFNIPWGHIRLIIDKYYDNIDKAIFYALKTNENNWSRAVLMNFIDTDLYEREGKAISNILKKDDDNQTIGLLICKSKDNIFARYSIESSKEPIAISEYELSKLYPKDFKSSMPTIEEIEKAIE